MSSHQQHAVYSFAGDLLPGRPSSALVLAAATSPGGCVYAYLKHGVWYTVAHGAVADTELHLGVVCYLVRVVPIQ